MLLKNRKYCNSPSHNENSGALSVNSAAKLRVPRLFTDISIERTLSHIDKSIKNSNLESSTPLTNTLTPSSKKTAAALKMNVDFMISKHGINRIVFLTLTFSDHILNPSEASRRRNSFFTNFLRAEVLDYICVLEPQKSGRCHYHLVAAVPYDVRTGVDIGAVFPPKESGKRPDYSTIPSELKSFWRRIRSAAPLHGFGRCEALPIRKTAEAVAYYVGKYISKVVENRPARFKFARLVTYSFGARMATTRFQFVCEGSFMWRRKMGIFARMVALSFYQPLEGLNIAQHLGVDWKWKYRADIFDIDIDMGEQVIEAELSAPF